MNENKIKLFSCLFAAGFVGIQGMQQAQLMEQDSKITTAQHAEQQYKVITGDLFIYDGFIYAGYEREHFAKIEDRICSMNGDAVVIKPSDTLVNLRVMSKESGNWATGYHPDLGTYGFPSKLPTSFFENKIEGEIIEFLFTKMKSDGEYDIFKIILTCKQAQYGGLFEKTFAQYKQEFAREPLYWFPDEERLREAGILPPKPVVANNAIAENSAQETEAKQTTAAQEVEYSDDENDPAGPDYCDIS